MAWKRVEAGLSIFTSKTLKPYKESRKGLPVGFALSATSRTNFRACPLNYGEPKNQQKSSKQQIAICEFSKGLALGAALVMASPETPEARETDGSAAIPPQSAVIIMEK